jgi:hypothetical protein
MVSISTVLEQASQHRNRVLISKGISKVFLFKWSRRQKSANARDVVRIACQIKLIHELMKVWIVLTSVGYTCRHGWASLSATYPERAKVLRP